MTDAEHEEIAAFMKAVADPAFKASQQPTTVADATQIRQRLTGLTKQLVAAHEALAALAQRVTVAEAEYRQVLHRLETLEKAHRKS